MQIATAHRRAGERKWITEMDSRQVESIKQLVVWFIPFSYRGRCAALLQVVGCLVRGVIRIDVPHAPICVRNCLAVATGLLLHIVATDDPFTVLGPYVSTAVRWNTGHGTPRTQKV
jgi:hypothetical protein